MNLREMRSYFYSLLGDPGEEKVQRGEAVRYINVGQNVVARQLVNIEREKFITTDTQPAVSSQELYNTPSDLQDIVRVTYNGVECTRHPVRELAALDDNTNYRASKGYQQFFYEIGGTVGLTQIGIRPIPDGTENIIITYIRRPTDFHDLGSFKITLDDNASEAHTTTTFNASNAPLAGSASISGTDDFWNNGEVRFTSGANKNLTRRIEDFDAISTAYGHFIIPTSTPLPDAPSDGDTAEIDQVSIIPEHHHDLVCLYAASLVAHKVGMDGVAMRAQFEKEVQAVHMKWQANVEAGIAGEAPPPPPQQVRV